MASTSRSSQEIATWLGLAIAALTLIGAFLVPEIRSFFGLKASDATEAATIARFDTGNRDIEPDLPNTGTDGTASDELATTITPQRTPPATVIPNVEPQPQPIHLRALGETPPQQDIDDFTAQLNDVLTQADPNAMRERHRINESDLVTTAALIVAIQSNSVTVQTSPGQQLVFTYDSSTLTYRDATRISGDDLRVGDRVILQWVRPETGSPSLYTIRVTTSL